MIDQVAHYEQLPVKDFKSSIPAHLLGKLSDGERYMVTTMSKHEGQYEWLLSAVQAQNRAVLDLDRRQSEADTWRSSTENRLKVVEDVSGQVRTLWDWKNTLTGKTGIILLICTITVPVLLKFIFDMILKQVH